MDMLSHHYKVKKNHKSSHWKLGTICISSDQWQWIHEVPDLALMFWILSLSIVSFLRHLFLTCPDLSQCLQSKFLCSSCVIWFGHSLFLNVHSSFRIFCLSVILSHKPRPMHPEVRTTIHGQACGRERYKYPATEQKHKRYPNSYKEIWHCPTFCQNH